MTSRKRVLAAVARRQPDRVPFYLFLTPHLEKQLRARHGTDDLEDFYRMDIRFAGYRAEPESVDHSAYTAHYPPDATVGAWGVGVRPVGYYHFGRRVHPLTDAATPEEVAAYPLPSYKPIIEPMRQEVAAIRAQGLAAVSDYESGTFEQANALMGMEGVLTAMHTGPDMVRLLFDRISDVKARIAAAYVQAGCDVLWIGDDIGSQRGPLMNPAMWREFLVPPLRKIIAAARAVRADVPIAYHSDGSIGFAAEGLIEAGVDVLQAVQPEANDLDELKALYGDRLAFWGGVGSQSTMSHGTPEDIRAEVRRLIDTLGRGGGYICSPSHRIEPESPPENVDALAAAIEEYGRYS
jgi:uroporphyrinogen decarboxylase